MFLKNVCVTNYVYSLFQLVGKEMQRQVCMLHFGENQAKRLHQKLEGETKGPNKMPSGPMSDAIQSANLYQLPVVQFAAVKWPDWLDYTEVMKLESNNNDQRLMFRLSKGVNDGKSFPFNQFFTNHLSPIFSKAFLDEQLLEAKIGTIGGSRFYNTCAAFLRYYPTVLKPDRKLKLMIKWIQRVKLMCYDYFVSKL